MKLENILREVEDELSRARKIHPVWSLDPIHGAVILAEEAGSVAKASLDFYYGRGGSHQLKKELIHTIAMGIRFLLSFEASERWMESFKTGREEAEALKKIREEEKNGRKP